MMTRDETPAWDELAGRLRRAFPGATFVRTDPGAPDLSALPGASRAFLTDVGLPDVNFCEFDFKLARTLPALHEYEAEREPGPDDRLDRVRCFAENFNQFIGIDAGRGGRVRWYDLGGTEPMFLNSGIEQFAAFLVESAEFVRHRGTAESADDALRAMVERMSAIDPPGVDGWWSVLIQEFELGLS